MCTINRTVFFFALIFLSIYGHSNQLAAQTLPLVKESAQEKPFSFPLQLEMRVPFDPTVFTNESKPHLIYELYLTNFSSKPISLRRIKLVDNNKNKDQAIAAFDSLQLQSMVQPSGEAGADKLALAGGQATIVFIEVILAAGQNFPKKLIHRISTETESLDGAIISTRWSKLQVLAAPIHGANWTAADGPGNSEYNHHRRGSIILEGRAINSRRYAIDWKKFRDSVSFSGDPKDVHSYFCYGKPVFAVADGRVISAKDGLLNNIPGHGTAFHPAIPLTFDRLAGNSIVIDLGNGHYAHYMHLQSGSLRISQEIGSTRARC